MTAKEVRTNLRIPEELYERIKGLASAEHRSINAQMIVLLQEAAAARQGGKSGKLRPKPETWSEDEPLPDDFEDWGN